MWWHGLDDFLGTKRAYPQGEERKAINEAFDKIVAELKLQKYLTHDDRIAPTPAAYPVYQIEPAFTAANYRADTEIAAAWNGTPESTQMSLFDNNGCDDYEDEDDMEI